MVAVIGRTGKKLMPMSEYKARKLQKKGRAEIHSYRPFTIRLLDREDGETQPIEYKCDTGYQNIGISICSEKHEYVHEERQLLTDEVEKHHQQKINRKARRNRKIRYRKPRFDNRKGLVVKDGFAPSIRNKRDMHIDLFKMYHKVMPITNAEFEMGQFDTQVLKAVAEGKPLPKGEDYQHGERYGRATLREAVFTRDEYTCQICGRTPFKNKAILHEHHIGYWKGDRTDRMSNLLTVCEKCHTTKNHQKSGKLYGLEPKLKPFKGATFMTIVRFDMFKKLKEAAPDVEFHMTYGARTKMKRRTLHIAKTHANDAYVMGSFHPKHRAKPVCYKKLRRNNRVLSTFYDAKIIDERTGEKVSGKNLSCNRTKRNIPRNNDKNLRIYRGKKVTKGHTNIRRRRYPIRPGDKVIYDGKVYRSKGAQHYGEYITLEGHEAVKTKDLIVKAHTGGWLQIPDKALRPA